MFLQAHNQVTVQHDYGDLKKCRTYARDSISLEIWIWLNGRSLRLSTIRIALVLHDLDEYNR
jgi:hypothetical protein